MDKIRPSHDFFKIGVPDGTATRVDNVFRQQVRRHMPFRTHGNFIQGGVGGDGGLTRQRSLFHFVVFVGHRVEGGVQSLFLGAQPGESFRQLGVLSAQGRELAVDRHVVGVTNGVALSVHRGLGGGRGGGR